MTRVLYVFILFVLLCGRLDAIKKIHWEQWPSRAPCRRACSEPLGIAIFTRDCVKCTTSRNCRKIEPANCEGLATKTRECPSLDCYGQGPYIGTLTPWGTPDRCPSPTLPCADAVQNFYRGCKKIHKPRFVKQTIFRCDEREKLHKTVKCRCGKVARRKSPQRTQTRRVRGLQLNLRHKNAVGTWSAWTPWSKCSCTSCNGLRTRTRKCLGNGADCEGPETEKEKCPASGCGKTWANWSDWTRCSSSCGAGQLRYRERKCVRTAKECEGETKQVEPCAWDEKKCPVIDGNWGEWDEWSSQCSVTCGTGVTQRTRQCDSPSASGYGEPCAGEKHETQQCQAAGCDIDGAWSPWSGWICNKACGGSRKIRRRLCNQPRPQFGGRTCTGNNMETIRGCPGTPCPVLKKGQFNREQLKATEDLNLKLQASSYTTNRGKSVNLTCQNYVVDFLQRAFPADIMTWLHNGELLPADDERRLADGNSLLLQKVATLDNGVYTAQIQHGEEEPHVVGVYTLTVNSGRDAVAIYGSGFDLDCFGDSLSTLFPALHQLWIHNKTATTRQPEPVGLKRLVNMDYSKAGLWECELIDTYTNRIWLANRLNVTVRNETWDNSTGSISDEETVTAGYLQIIYALVGMMCIAGVIGVTVRCIAKRRNREFKAEKEATKKRLKVQGIQKVFEAPPRQPMESLQVRLQKRREQQNR